MLMTIVTLYHYYRDAGYGPRSAYVNARQKFTEGLAGDDWDRNFTFRAIECSTAHDGVVGHRMLLGSRLP